jgi:polyisoprenoid-binding protein YceI
LKQFSGSALFVALAVLAGASAVHAEPRVFTVDRSHSEVGFNVRHFFTKVRGQFNDYTATVNYDPKNVAASSVEVVIRDSSINTANDRRDNHLRSEDFFWVEKHPTITFKSNKVTPGKDSTRFQVAGDLTIRGISKPVVLDVENLGMAPVAIEGRDMGTRAGFLATTRVNRKDYGIVWNRTIDQGGMMLGDDVDIVLNIEAVSRPPAPPAPAEKAAEKTPDKK